MATKISSGDVSDQMRGFEAEARQIYRDFADSIKERKATLAEVRVGLNNLHGKMAEERKEIIQRAEKASISPEEIGRLMGFDFPKAKWSRFFWHIYSFLVS